MAKLDLFPDDATVIALRKRVDFYYWKGIPVARSWPVYVPYTPSPAELETRQEFQASVKMTGAIGTAVRELYRAQMYGQGVTWVDWFRASSRAKPWGYLVR